MVYLVDTNVLLRLVDRGHPHHTKAVTAVRRLRRDDHDLRVTAQNFVEFWNAATRPRDRNGLGLSLRRADRLLSFLERLFPLLADSATVYPEWRRLVVEFGVSGVQVHDTRLVLPMLRC